MPELPEVETIRRDLAPHLLGRSFQEAVFLWEGAVRSPSAEELRRRLPGQVVRDLARRGKYLLFRLDGGLSLIVHLKMTGALLLKEAGAPPDRHTRVLFRFRDGPELHFSDPRKFGRIWLVQDEAAVVGALGPEPLAMSASALAQRLAHRKAPLKPLLLDQGVLAGVGNIYADEALFQASLHPRRPAGTLTPAEVRRLHRALRLVLKGAIARRGTSLRDYRDAWGAEGANQYALQVHRREGQPCPRCHTPVQRIVLRNRSTYFCPRCQAPPHPPP